MAFKETQRIIMTLNALCKHESEQQGQQEAGIEMKGHCSLLPLNEQLFAEVQTESWEPLTSGGHRFSVPRLIRPPAEVLKVPAQPANYIFMLGCTGGICLGFLLLSAGNSLCWWSLIRHNCSSYSSSAKLQWASERAGFVLNL